MQAWIEKLSGKRTYGLAVVLLLLAGADVGGVVPEENRLAVYSVVVAALAATLRAAVAKLNPAPQVVKNATLDSATIRETLTGQLAAAVHELHQLRKLDASVRELQEKSDRQLRESREAFVEEKLPPGSTVVQLPSLTSGLLLLCCLVPAISSAADIRIVGPSAVPAPGYPCELFIQGDLPTGTKIVWDHTPRTEGFDLVDTADRHKPIVRLNTMAGQYKLIVAVTPPGDAVPVIRYHDFTVPGTPYTPAKPPGPKPQPQPAPEPTPEPTPPQPIEPVPPPPVEPVFDDGQFGMAARTYQAVMAVKSASRRTEVICLAAKIAELISGIRSGAIASPQAAVNALAAAFEGCLSADWDAARDRVTDRVAELLAGRRLTTMQHWQTLATEALIGLNEAAKR